MNTTRLALSIPSTLLWVIAAHAQSDDDLLPRDGRSLDLSSGAWIQTQDGVPWGMGNAYKARFDAQGVEFTPALGPGAPRNEPWRFTLETIRRGETTHLEASSAIRPTVHERVVQYAHPGGILETYEVREDGLKQSFVFPRPLAGRGDLVVRGLVTTDLVAEVGEGRSGFAFDSTDHGGVEIRGVLGIDSAGHEVPGHMNFDGRRLEFVLPEWFADRAVYPLVLDPFIGGSFRADLSGSLSEEADIAIARSTYLIAWQRIYSASDYDVLWSKIRRDGTHVGTQAVQVTNTRELYPSACGVGSGDFVIVWQSEGTLGTDILGTSVLPNETLLQRSIQAIDAGSGDQLQPVVGGDTRIGQDQALVFYVDRGTNDLNLARVQVGTTIGLSVSGRLSLGGNSYVNPAICESGGGVARFFCAAERNTSQGGIEHAIVDIDLNRTWIGLLGEGRRPAVAGDGWEFVLVYEQPESPQRPAIRDIRAWTYYYCGFVGQAACYRTGAAIQVDSNVFQAYPTVARLDRDYVVGWCQESTRSGYYEFVARGFRERTLQPTTSAHRILVPGGPAPCDVVSEAIAGHCNDRALTVYRESANTVRRVRGRFYKQTPEGTATTVSPGCGGLTLTPLGTPENDSAFGWRLDGVRGIGRIWVGFSQVQIPWCSQAACIVGTPFDVWLDVSEVPPQLPPCDPAFHGSVHYVQGLDFAIGQGSGCPSRSVPGFELRLSNTVRVVWG